MTRYITFRMVLMGLGLLVFWLAPGLPALAQNADTCKDPGWTAIDGSRIDLSGRWTGNQNRLCSHSASWQFPGFSVTITKENGVYYAQIGNEDKTEIEVSGSNFIWGRDVRKGAGAESPGIYTQTWRGKIETNGSGSIRIYGTWTGAWKSKKYDGYNLDFLLVKN